MGLIKLGVKGGLVYLVANKIAEKVHKSSSIQENAHATIFPLQVLYTSHNGGAIKNLHPANLLPTKPSQLHLDIADSRTMMG
ncbi:hypothetical protein ACHAPF_005162 [Botrytis cinerea]|uniref:Uncharacterized protein n=1 Tax=Botryotinia fuckeliana (strain T4) TaxID=999810 RepID=G2YYY8_BOTF4|nr:hypothetical protein BofuT4_uP140980.1 [Botrytis cinerea T4]